MVYRKLGEGRKSAQTRTYIKYQRRDHRFLGYASNEMHNRDDSSRLVRTDSFLLRKHMQAERLIMRPVNQRGSRDDLCIVFLLETNRCRWRRQQWKLIARDATPIAINKTRTSSRVYSKTLVEETKAKKFKIYIKLIYSQTVTCMILQEV